MPQSYKAGVEGGVSKYPCNHGGPDPKPCLDHRCLPPTRGTDDRVRAKVRGQGLGASEMGRGRRHAVLVRGNVAQVRGGDVMRLR